MRNSLPDVMMEFRKASPDEAAKGFKSGGGKAGEVIETFKNWWCGAGDITKMALTAALFFLIAAVAVLLYLLIKKRRKRGYGAMKQNGTEQKTEIAAVSGRTEKIEPSAGREQDASDEEKAPLAYVRRDGGVRPPGCYVGKLHDIGGRKDQQDSFGISDLTDQAVVNERGIFAIVADGMGGLSNGGEISELVTLTMMQYFYQNTVSEEPGRELLRMLNLANSQVTEKLGAEGLKKSGSTVVAVIVKNRNLYWIAVGDSHIYLYRNHALMQLNREHVYGVDLDERAARGDISFKEAAQDPQRKALTSFIGMGRLTRIDRNIRPLKLMEGDRVLLMSDGVFGTLSDDEMILAMEAGPEESAELLKQMIREKQLHGQDNYTAVILEVL